MTIYRTAGGRYFTREALFYETVHEANQGWDEATQGVFHFSFDDWLIEAINSGVIEAIDVVA